ncbi:MAG: type II toxin-antitoxin system VapC family toxin [Actinomycetota bacterium]|nr:type II toxin-antitoxin system VapC family toxin [Actinomycetota bacterium]
MLLVDANVLVYAVNTAAPEHRGARAWLLEALHGTEAIAFPWLVNLAFLRLTTHSSVLRRPLSVADAGDVLRRWLDRPPSIVLDPTHRHVPLLLGLLNQTGSGGNLVNDAHLAALALEHDATIVTYDRDFQRYAGVRWRRPD